MFVEILPHTHLVAPASPSILQLCSTHVIAFLVKMGKLRVREARVWVSSPEPSSGAGD